jgi:protein phosphatase methylesterase 1
MKVENMDCTPSTWDKYFDERFDVEVKSCAATFRVYRAGDKDNGPIFILLHGGGHSALTWALATVRFFFLLLCFISFRTCLFAL